MLAVYIPTSFLKARIKNRNFKIKNMNTNYSFETSQVHAGQVVDPITLSQAVPLYQTTFYHFKSTELGANIYASKEFGNIEIF